MNHETSRARQETVLSEALARLRAEPSVLGVRLTGSHARGEADAFSDIDLVVYLRDEARARRAELQARIAALAPLLCEMWVWDRHALFLYEDGVRLDVDFLPPAELAARPPDGRILHVPDGALADADARMPAHSGAEATPALRDDVTWFFWMFRQVVCWAKRGAQGGPRAYDKLANAVDSLGQIRNQLVAMRLFLAGRRDYVGRIDPEFAERLARTYPALNADEIIACAGRLREEFERWAPDYCARTSRVWPEEQAATLRCLWAEFASL